MDGRTPLAQPPRRALGDAKVVLLSALLAFCLWFGGGWLLAEQINGRPTGAEHAELGLSDGGGPLDCSCP